QEFWTGFYSAYSSFLWVAGARALVDQCLALELDDEAGWVLERLSGMEEAMEAAFRREDGAWLPYVLEEGLAPAPGLFEDVSLQPLWLGLEDPEDPAARENLATVIAELGGEDGILISPLPETYHGFMELPVTQGIYTGMNPGHYLWALSATRHPAAEAAFRALALHATPTGSSPEYQVLDDFSPLHLMSSATGSEPCDYTARYRPWEGGVNAEALVFFLLGLRPDAPAQELGLAPHLPAGWRWLDAQGLRVGDTVVDLELRRPTAERWLLRLTHRGGEGIRVRLELPVDGEAVLTLDGEPHPAERVDSGFGTHVLRAAPLDLAPGHSVVLATDPP
ncbi:MAG: hypothetical protein FJ098_15320, partial [Deltaproteobacteria bacterium]|nr:hypothetical protein [Deltaproteobacteria bacterium]